MSQRITELKPGSPAGTTGATQGNVAVAVATTGAASRAVEVLAPNVLRTSRMVLRPLRASDHDEFLRMIEASRAEVERWVRPHREGETDEQLFERQLVMCREGDERGLAARRVAVLDDGRIAGCFNLNSITRGLIFEADFTWWISTNLAGRGLGTEGAEAMLDYAFFDLPRGLGLHRVQAAVHPENVRSVRMAQKLGLKKQEGATVAIRFGDEWQAHDLYARIASC